MFTVSISGIEYGQPMVHLYDKNNNLMAVDMDISHTNGNTLIVDFYKPLNLEDFLEGDNK